MMQTAAAIRRKSLRRSIKVQFLNHWQLYLMMIPAVAYIIIFAYVPMYGILMAFKDFSLKKGILGSPWCGVSNFVRLFKSYWFPVILKNTLSVSLLSLVIGFPIPILFALMVNEVGNGKVKQVLQTVSYAPHFISTVVICGMILLFLSPSTGIINLAIQALGMEPVYFMASPTAFKWVYVLSGVWQGTGWGAIIYFAALAGVDKSLLEAAEIDGATRIQRIIHINFQVLVPTIVIMLILQCGQLLSVGYEKVLLLQNDSNLSGSEVISTYVYKVGLVDFDYAFSTASGIFNSICNTVILVAANTLSKKFANSSLW